MADVKLLPCPWCGEGNSVVEVYYCDASHAHRVGCGACGVSTGIHPRDRSAEHAVATWNARANISHATAPLHAEIERLKGLLGMYVRQQERDAAILRKVVEGRGAVRAQRDMLAEALREVCDFILHDGCPVDPDHPKRRAIDAAEEAIARASQTAKEQP